VSKLLKAITWVLAAVALFAAGLFLYLKNADLGAYEEEIEAYLSRAIGHEVEVSGALELDFGNLTRLTAEQVTLSNADWQPESRLLSADYLSVTVRLWSLIDSPVVIEDFELRGLDVIVEKNSAGQSNWESGLTKQSTPQQEEFDPDLIAFRNAHLTDVHFLLVDPARARPLNISLKQLDIAPGENDILSLELAGVINEFPLVAQGKVGPWQNLLDGKDLAMDLDVTLGRVRLTVDGSVADLTTLEGVSTALEVQGPAIERVTDVLGMPRFAEGAFKLDGKIRKVDNDHQFTIAGNLGAITIDSNGHVDRIIKPQRAELHFDYAGPDTERAAAMFGIEGAIDLPFQISGDATKDGSRFGFSETQARIGDNEITMNGWIDASAGVPNVDLTIAASGPNLSVIGPFTKVSGIPAETFRIDGRVRKTGSSVRFDGAKIEVGENRITAEGALEGRGSEQTTITFEASGPDISILEAMTKLRGIPQKPYTISAEVRPDPAGIMLRGAVGIFGDNRVEADGVVGLKSSGLTGTDLRLKVSGSDLDNVALLARAPYLPPGPFKGAGRIQIGKADHLTLTDATADTAGFSAKATGTIGIRANAGRFDLDVSASGPDLAGFLQFEFLDRLEGEDFQAEGGISYKAGVIGLDQVRASIGNMKADVDGTVVKDASSADLALKVRAPDARVLSEISGYNDLPDGAVSIDGRLRKAPGRYDLDEIKIRIGDNQLTANGKLSQEPLKNNSDLRFSVTGPNLAQLVLPFGIKALPAKPVSVSGEVNGIPTGFAIEKLDAKLGDSTLTGQFTADLRGKPAVSGVLSSTLIEVGKPEQDPEQEPESETIEKEVPPADQTGEFVFSRDPFEVDWLQYIDLDIDINIDRLFFFGLDFREVETSVDLRGGTLDIKHLSGHEGGGKASVDFQFGPLDDAYELDGTLSLENVRASFIDFAAEDLSNLPPIDGQMKIRGTGNSPHQIVASSTGVVDFKQGAGRTRDLAFLRRLRSLIAQVAQPDDPILAQRPFISLECAFYNANIKSGIATVEKLAVQSDTVTIIALGSINLDNEKLDLSLRMKQRKGIGINLIGVANSFMKLGGTLRAPKMQLDPTGSVATTGAAFATGGLSILAKGLWDRASAGDGICDAEEGQ